MPRYYVLDCLSPLRKANYTLEVEYPANDKAWRKGASLTPGAEWEDEQPPPEPIEVKTREELVDAHMFIYPELAWMPIPLMTRRLVAALRNAGVDNLQTFETLLVAPQGNDPPPPNHYLAVNVLGLLAAADENKSQSDPGTGRLIYRDFHSLAIDETKARDILMFRLAENTSAVIVHERVKQAVETQGIQTLSWISPERWAG